MQSFHFEGEGDFAFDAVGESFYQDALLSIVGEKSADGVEMEVVAELRPEPDNPYDKNAIAIVIDGHKVGHLPRAFAEKMTASIRKSGAEGVRITCDAVIVGGWKRSGSEGFFGVKLDL